MNPFSELIMTMTSGTFGAIITIAIITLTAVAITRTTEKIMILLLPLTIGYNTIGFGWGNPILLPWMVLVVTLFGINVFYEIRYLGPKLTTKIGKIKSGEKLLNKLYEFTIKKRQENENKKTWTTPTTPTEQKGNITKTLKKILQKYKK